jgi:hypothetical protein
MVRMDRSTILQRGSGDGALASLGILTVVILVLEFLAALWIQGILFTAVLFGLMSVAFSCVIAVLYLLKRHAVSRVRFASPRWTVAASIIEIALFSALCIALLAGIFSLPLLFHGGKRQLQRWQFPTVLGARNRAGCPSDV